MFILAQHDMPGRMEQTILLQRTLLAFGCPKANARLRTVPKARHCSYNRALDDLGESVLGRMLYEFMKAGAQPPVL